MEIAGKMQINIFHRYDLGITAACRPAFDAKTRAERRFAQANHRFFANVIKRIAKAYGGGGFALRRPV